MLKRFWNTNWLMHKFVGITFIVMGFWGLGSSLFSKSYTIDLPIKQTHPIQEPKTLLKFPNAQLIYNKTVLEIKNPSILQRIFWPNQNDFEPLIWLVILITGIVTIKVFMQMGSRLEFDKKNLTWFRVLWGSYITCFFILHFSKYFINSYVQTLTNGQIEFNKYGSSNATNLVWIGFLIGILYRFYEKGTELQKSPQ